MTDLAFRNVDASPDDPVESWPYEALITAMERGYLSHWRRIAAAINRSPWGQVARDVESYANQEPNSGAAVLLAETVRRARQEAVDFERTEIARRIRQAIALSGMTAGGFARLTGTSASRMSTYAAGRVMPSAGLLLRVETAAATAAVYRPAPHR